MKALRLISGIGLAAVACACAAVGMFGNRVAPGVVGVAPDVPQCGQWCVLRCCELLGAPLHMSDVLEVLPPRDEGNSLFQIREALQSVGLGAEGQKQPITELTESTQFPVLAHLHSPDHFVVVAGVDGDRVHLFAGKGRRNSVLRDRLAERWSGKVLRVTRGTSDVALPSFLPRRNGAPRLQFDCLFLDKGDVPVVGEPVSFEYRFVNLGNRALVIEAVHPTCPCIEADFPKSPLPPAAEGLIKLVFRNRDANGPFVHETTVETNDPLLPVVVLKAAGYADTGVVVSRARLNLGDVVAGERTVAACFVRRAADDRDFTILEVECDLEGSTVRHFAIGDADADVPWWPGARGGIHPSKEATVVEVSWRPPAATSDHYVERRMVIRTNLERFERIAVTVAARVVTPVGLYPSVVSFGEVTAEGTVEQTVKVASRDGTAFRVVGIRPESPGIESSFTNASDGGQAELRFIATGDAAVGAAGTSFVVDVELQSGKKLSLPLPTAAWPRPAVDTIEP